MKNAFSIVLAAILALAVNVTAAPAKGTVPPTVPTPGHVAVGSHARQLLVIVDATTLTAWSYDPVSHKVAAVEVPATGYQPKPVAGVKLVLRRVCSPAPCSAAYPLTLNARGSAAFPASLQVGLYALTLSVPANVITSKTGVSNAALTMTLHLVVGRTGIATDANVLPVVAPQ